MELLELIRTQVRAELQAQQLAGQSTNASTADATVTPNTAPGRSQANSKLCVIFVSVHTYYAGRAGKHAPRPVTAPFCAPQPPHAHTHTHTLLFVTSCPSTSYYAEVLIIFGPRVPCSTFSHFLVGPHLLILSRAPGTRGACIFPSSCSYRHICATCQLQRKAKDCPHTSKSSIYKRPNQRPPVNPSQ